MAKKVKQINNKKQQLNNCTTKEQKKKRRTKQKQKYGDLQSHLTPLCFIFSTCSIIALTLAKSLIQDPIVQWK